jgi:glutamyl/glutaminyl-tRNA synthetase
MKKNAEQSNVPAIYASTLKQLYTNFTSGVAVWNLSGWLKKRKVPYFGMLSPVLVNQGILKYSRKKGWSWISATEPNSTMAKAVYEEVKKYTAGHSKNVKTLTKYSKVYEKKATIEIPKSNDILELFKLSLKLVKKEVTQDKISKFSSIRDKDILVFVNGPTTTIIEL